MADFPHFWIFYPIPPPSPPCPVGSWVVNCLCPFPDESAYMCQIWSRSVQRFGIFPTFLNLWPPNPLQMPLDVSRGYFFLTYIHSQMNLHMCAKFGPDRSSCLGSILHFLICDPLTPSQMPLGVSSPLICLAYVHSQMNLHVDVCRIWSRSVQLLGIFPTFLNLWPPDPLQMPLDVSRGYFF